MYPGALQQVGDLLPHRPRKGRSLTWDVVETHYFLDQL